MDKVVGSIPELQRVPVLRARHRGERQQVPGRMSGQGREVLLLAQRTHVHRVLGP